jgi:hypothetical protein
VDKPIGPACAICRCQGIPHSAMICAPPSPKRAAMPAAGRANTADCDALSAIMTAIVREDHRDFSPDAQTHARISGGR